MVIMTGPWREEDGDWVMPSVGPIESTVEEDDPFRDLPHNVVGDGDREYGPGGGGANDVEGSERDLIRMGGNGF